MIAYQSTSAGRLLPPSGTAPGAPNRTGALLGAFTVMGGHPSDTAYTVAFTTVSAVLLAAALIGLR